LARPRQSLRGMGTGGDVYGPAPGEAQVGLERVELASVIERICSPEPPRTNIAQGGEWPGLRRGAHRSKRTESGIRRRWGASPCPAAVPNCCRSPPICQPTGGKWPYAAL